MASNRVTTIFDAVDRGLSDAVNRVKKSINEAEGATGKLKAGWQGVVTEFKNSREAQAAVAAGAVTVAVASIKAASDLEESINAVNVTYGKSSEAVLALGEDADTAFGMSQRAFNEFSTGFSAFANQIAENSGQRVEDVVENMATRIADFASVHNLSLQEAEQVAKSTLAGETEAFRRFGGDVSAATIETFAYENGIADVGDELTEGQKVLARYGAFMEQTNKVAGDFANPSASLANQQRIAAARTEDLAAMLGAKLIPVASEALEQVNELALGIENMANLAGDVKNLEIGPIKVSWLTDGAAAWNPMSWGGEVRKVADILGGPFTYAGKRAVKELYNLGRSATDAEELSGDLVETASGPLVDALNEAAEAAEAEQAAMEASEDALHGLGAQGDRYVETLEQAGEEQKAVNDALAESKQRADDASYAIQRLDGSWDSLRGDIDGANTWLDLQDQFDQVEVKAEEAWTAAAEGADDAEQKARDYERSMNDTKIAVGDYATEVLNLPDEVVSKLIADIDAGKKAEVEAFLKRLGDGVTLPIRPKIVSSDGSTGTSVRVDENGNLSVIGAGANGGIVTRPTNALIGEAGPEAVIPLDRMPGASPLPAGLGGGSINITVNAGMGTDGAAVGRQIVKALNEYKRSGGQVNI